MVMQLPKETKLPLFLTKMGTFSTTELQRTCIKMIARMCRSKTCLGGQKLRSSHVDSGIEKFLQEYEMTKIVTRLEMAEFFFSIPNFFQSCSFFN